MSSFVFINHKKPIILVGMMGSGKSAVGKILAKKLNRPFFDSDDEIISQERMSIADIFDIKGEVYFRDKEAQIISGLLQKNDCVIATGGGALLSEVTAQAIKDKALSVWLKADLETIFKRLKNNTARPLLRGGDARQKLENLLTKREHLYAKADIIIHTDALSPQEVAENIIKTLN